MRVLQFLRARLGWIVLMVLVAAAAAGGLAYRNYRAAEARRLEAAALRTEVVGRADIVAAVSATGTILPAQQTDLFFLLPGTVVTVAVDTGDRVAAGQLLAQLDETELALAARQAEDALAVAEINRDKLTAGPRAEDIDIARANLRSANARAGDLGAGASDVAIAEAQYANLKAAYDKLADQYNTAVQFGIDHPQFAAPADVLEPMKANMEIAYYQAEVARLQLQLARQGAGQGPQSVAWAQIGQAQAVLSQTLAGPSALQIDQAALAVRQAETTLQHTRLRLAQTHLTAPHAGIVASVGIQAGEPASLSAPAIVLVDVDHFYLEVAVDEVDVARLAAGQPLSITVDALPDTPLSGHVDRIAPAATGTGGLVSYSVRLVLDPTTVPLRVGMSATADIVVAQASDVVLVPNWAIRRDRRTGQAYASLLVDGQLIEVPITAGLRGEAYTEVASGVDPGAVAAITTAREGLDLLNP